MALTKDKKSELIEKYRDPDNPMDTGTPEVQVALLSERIAQLTVHLRANRHDFSSRRGLMMLIGQRRRMLNYLARKSTDRYRALIGSLGLRR